MAAHARPFVNVMEENVDKKLIEKVKEIQTPIDIIRAQLRRHGLIPINHVDNEACTFGVKIDESLESCVQQLIYKGIIQIGRLNKKNVKEMDVVDITYTSLEIQISVTPLVIQISAPFPYESAKADPWRYKPKVYKKGH